MKKLVLPKRIIGVFILICISLVPFFSVDAKDKSKCEEVLSEDAVKRYGLQFEPKNKKEKKFVISMDPQTDNKTLLSKLKKIKFKVIKINGFEQNLPTGTLNYKNDLVMNAVWQTVGDEKIMSVTLESTVADVDGDFCKGKGVIRFTLTYIKGGDPQEHNVYIDTSDLDNDKIDTTNPIDCNSSPKSDLDRLFCNAKKKVLEKQPRAKNKKNSIHFSFDGKYYSGYNDDKEVKYELKWDKFDLEEKDTPTFKCDYKSAYSLDELQGDNYYKEENKSYLYGSGSYEIPFKYNYHYSPGSDPETHSTSCKVKCEEAVTIEYGPPVASKAGLCFEYKVKVTSVVNCSMTKPPEPPKTDFSYCDPAPICTTSSGFVGNQGGPNEEFDSCIKNCDGGKYTDKCNNKCYEEVYNNSLEKVMFNSLQIGAIEKMANSKSKITKNRKKITKKNNLNRLIQHDESYFSMNNCKAINNGGCYAKNSDGSIRWEGGPTFAGRWYDNNPHKDYSEYVKDRFGFWRHLYRNKNEKGEIIETICTDNCKWVGCDNAKYLNPKFAEQDYINNKKIYDQAKKLCKAAASCSTTTATFTISVDYKHNVKNGNGFETKSETIDFPYENKKDKLNSNGTNTVCKSGDALCRSTLLDNDGCYKDKENERWYRAEWSFPGTWIENKTGNITYVPKTGTDWQNMKQKFCIPLDALDVNQKWWRYYYNKKLATPNSTTDPSYKNECGNNSNSITNPANVTKEDITWNIHAKTRKFGFYAWNINIDCFYALNSNPANVSTSDDKSKQDKCIINDQKGSNDYKIRPVDLTNLFPATDGGDSNLTDPKSTGRTPGFNWSQYANTGNKNLSYASKPSEYVETVQRLGYKVYNDENLDYQFILTRDILNDMKTTTKVNGKNYTEFNGKTEVKNGVVHYISSAIRSGSELSKAKKKIPDSGNIFCNNMKNYSQGCR